MICFFKDFDKQCSWVNYTTASIGLNGIYIRFRLCEGRRGTELGLHQAATVRKTADLPTRLLLATATSLIMILRF